MRHILVAAMLALSALWLPGCATSVARTQVMETASRVTAEYAAAWNANDMYRFGALFTPDARYVNLSGDFVRGRAAIVSTHGANRARYPAGVRMSARLEGARSITDDAIVSVMLVQYSSTPAPANAAPAARITLTLVKQRGAWLIAQAQASAPS